MSTDYETEVGMDLCSECDKPKLRVEGFGGGKDGMVLEAHLSQDDIRDLIDVLRSFLEQGGLK
jgi:hypothetical protein